MPIRYLFDNTAKLNDNEKQYVEEKILKCTKLLNHYTDDELMIEVEVEQDKRGFWIVTVMIQTPHELYRVSKKGQKDEELMMAVDLAEEALMKQIKRNKEKIRDQRRKNKAKLASAKG